MHTAYYWLTCTGDAHMNTLLHLCPEVVLNQYLAVTSLDSGIRLLTREEQEAGWQSCGDVAYSPLIQSIEGLQYQDDGLDEPGYDEWYVFNAPRDLGRWMRGNPYEFEFAPGQLMPL